MKKSIIAVTCLLLAGLVNQSNAVDEENSSLLEPSSIPMDSTPFASFTAVAPELQNVSTNVLLTGSVNQSNAVDEENSQAGGLRYGRHSCCA